MRRVGDSVVDQDGVAGIVVSDAMHPAGVLGYLVRQDGPLFLNEMLIADAELQDGPELLVLMAGDKVRLYGSDATINADNGDGTYDATIVIARPSGLRFTHRYPIVPAWHFAMEKEAARA